MGWVSFDIFRTLGFDNTLQLKPEQLFSHKAVLSEADWVLFPEYWQLNTLIYGYHARAFPSQASYLIGHDKIEMTRAFQAVAPTHTPTTHIVANTPHHADQLWEKLDLPCVAKLPKSSQGEGVWLIDNRADWQAYRQRTDILYVQEYLPIDRDIRIVIVGDEVLAAYWRLQGSDGFHNNLARGGAIDHSPVPPQAIELARQLARDLDINHAGFDIAMVGEHPYVLEFNRLFGNQGIPGGDVTVRQAILRYLHDDTAPNPVTPDKPRRHLRQIA